MKILHVTVADKVATYTRRDGEIICGNKDYKIVFTFDSEWDAYPTKTARFVTKGQPQEVVFTGNECPVPAQHGAKQVEVGVFAGDLLTTTAAVIPCRRSIRCSGGEPVAPAPNVYDQIMALLNGTTRPPAEDGSVLPENVEAHIKALQEDVAVLNLIVGQTIITETEVEDTFSARQTAGGLDIIDGLTTEVKKIVGNTVAKDGALVNATFGGIKSTSADGTKESGIALAKPVELGKWDVLDVESGEITRQTFTFAVADVEYGGYSGVTSFGSQGNYYVSFTFVGLPIVERDTLSKKNVVSNYYEWSSVTTNGNKRCFEYSSMSATGKSAPRFDFRDDDLLVFNGDGTIDKDATISAFKAHFVEIGLQIAYKPSEVQSTEVIDCPKEYAAYNGGQESILPNGDECTVTQTYIAKSGVNI